MAIEKTLGGNRLGSGNKMKIRLNHFNRSTHNLNKTFSTSLAPGVLVPCYVNIAKKGDSIDIDLNAMAYTIPTQGPLFGSYKMQIDFFAAPIRLYQGVLHNNPTNIGLRMKQVYLPKIYLRTRDEWDINKTNTYDNSQINPTSLLKYLGISGIGSSVNSYYANVPVGREFGALGILTYYDTFKNYYANKQEENAYVITSKGWNTATPTISNIEVWLNGNMVQQERGVAEITFITDSSIIIKGSNLSLKGVEIDGQPIEKIADTLNIEISSENKNEIIIYYKGNTEQNLEITEGNNTLESEIGLVPFPLANIDEMRYDILSRNRIGQKFVIGKATSGTTKDGDYLPYNILFKTNTANITYNTLPLNGLLVKTYQSDMFNCWLKTDWIDGPNGIKEITRVDVRSGYMELDALNFATKIYKMLNKVVASGNTYQDWEEATTGEKAIRHAETPMYIGGMASEVVFEEVIQQAETTNQGQIQKLGTIGGKGTLMGKKAGHINFKANEACVVMGIVSLTPRINYCQGNKWFNTEIDTMDDLHKPDFDNIGFQELMQEQMAWWTTKMNADTIESRPSAGKVTAWLNYQTDVDEVYGDFADPNRAEFMVLNRRYERDLDQVGEIKDLTTYIDPTKYNYAFAYTMLDAQNFWIQIAIKATYRRLMSAHEMPNI